MRDEKIAKKKLTINDIKNKKGVEPIVMITAYDALFAKILMTTLMLSLLAIV